MRQHGLDATLKLKDIRIEGQRGDPKDLEIRSKLQNKDREDGDIQKKARFSF